MENFNIQRFGNVCSRLVMIRKKEYFNIFLSMMLLFAFMSVLTCNPLNLEPLSDEQYKLGFFGMGGFFAAVLAIYIILAGSMVIRDLKTKQQR